MNRTLGRRIALTCSLALPFALGAGPAPSAGSREAPKLQLVGHLGFNAPGGGTVKLGEFRVCVRDAAGTCVRDDRGNVLYEQRDFAFTTGAVPGSTSGLRVIDVTDPTAPVLAGSVCLTRYSEGGIDIRPDLGLLVAEGVCSGPGSSQVVTVFDVSDPLNPKVLSTVLLGDDVHGVTFHPRQPVVYVSTNAKDVATLTLTFPILDLSDPAAPRVLQANPAPVAAAHAISFNRGGTRAYVASQTRTDILDTTNPLSPTLVASIHDPSVKWHSWAKASPSGRWLAVGDVFLDDSEPCPGGAVHFYNLVVETRPLKVGAFTDPKSTTVPPRTPCPNHYFDFDPATGRMALPWSSLGTYLLDLTDPRGLGAQEVARTDTAVTWDAQSATFYEGRIYVIDDQRGLDVFEVPIGYDKTGTVAPGAALEWDGTRATGTNTSGLGNDGQSVCGQDQNNYCEHVWIRADLPFPAGSIGTTHRKGLAFTIDDFDPDAGVYASDFDLAVYASDATGAKLQFLGVARDSVTARREDITIDVTSRRTYNADGTVATEHVTHYFLAEIVYFFAPNATYRGTVRFI